MNLIKKQAAENAPFFSEHALTQLSRQVNAK